MSYKLEYIWLDGCQPEPRIRGKTKIVDSEPSDPSDCPEWGFDGSSTEQAAGDDSDCLLRPVRLARDPARSGDGFLVLCEVYSADDTPHPSNVRSTFEDDDDFWFGFEQEYTLMLNGLPLGFPTDGYPGPQGPYYCSVGTGNAAGRDVVESHLDSCLDAGLGVSGINAEVMKGQWEYQLLGKGAKQAADDLWLSRYLLHRNAESYGVWISLHPKPIKGDWNGSGMHANFSNGAMRTAGNRETFIKVESPTPGKDRLYVLKLNNVLKFNTGIYDYSVMTSVFSAVEGLESSKSFELCKITLSAQEWCGHVFEEVQMRQGRLQGALNSYFEREGRQLYELPVAGKFASEDHLLIRIRELRGPILAAGEEQVVQLLPALWHLRALHRPRDLVKARLAKGHVEQIEVGGDSLAAIPWSLETEGREKTIWVEKAYPRRILAWMDSAGGRGELLATLREPYWQLQSNADEVFRTRLQIP